MPSRKKPTNRQMVLPFCRFLVKKYSNIFGFSFGLHYLCREILVIDE